MSVASTLANLHWTHALTVKLTQGWPADRETYQSTPTDNHILWTLGHLAVTYDWFRSMLVQGQSMVPSSYQGLFGYQSKPSTDRSVYPSMTELRTVFDSSFSGFAAAAARLTEAEASLAPLVDSGGFCTDRLDAVHKAAWHDGWHSGQLASLRKALALPSVFG